MNELSCQIETLTKKYNDEIHLQGLVNEDIRSAALRNHHRVIDLQTQLQSKENEMKQNQNTITKLTFMIVELSKQKMESNKSTNQNNYKILPSQDANSV